MNENNEQTSKSRKLQQIIKYSSLTLSILLWAFLFILGSVNIFMIWTQNEFRGAERFETICYAHDQSDVEWTNINNHVYVLFIIPFLFLIITSKIDKIDELSLFYIFFGVAYCFLLFRLKTIYTLLFVIFNYFITKQTAQHNKIFIVLILIFNIGVINVIFIFNGITIDYINQNILSFDQQSAYVWHIVFSYTFLRCLSFSFDYYYYLNKSYQIDFETHFKECSECTVADKCTQQRTVQGLQQSDYNLQYFLSYIFYFPLFYRGPLITYNDFINQLHRKQGKRNKIAIVSNSFKICLYYILVELMNISMFPTAFVLHQQNQYLWRRKFKPYEIFSILICYLLYQWIKFVFYWKFGLFITNLDNIDVVDNVGKCIFNCTSLKDLLKNYEKSLYNWVLRYIYTPLGGIHTRFLNIFLIMLFYILINEMTNKVFFWALIIAFLFNVEVFLKAKLKEYNINKLIISIGASIQLNLVLYLTIWAYIPEDEVLTLALQSLQNKKGLSIGLVFAIYLAIYFQVLFEFKRRELQNYNQIKIEETTEKNTIKFENKNEQLE